MLWIHRYIVDLKVTSRIVGHAHPDKGVVYRLDRDRGAGQSHPLLSTLCKQVLQVGRRRRNRKHISSELFPKNISPELSINSDLWKPQKSSFLSGSTTKALTPPLELSGHPFFRTFFLELRKKFLFHSGPAFFAATLAQSIDLSKTLMLISNSLKKKH